MSEYYLSIDIGASGGRHYVGCLENGRLAIKEIHRFGNGPVSDGSNLVWDTDRIFSEIITGMKKCAAAGIEPVSVGVDTWGVDYVLLDAGGERIGKSYSYRDMRADGMEDRFDALMPPSDLYGRTGIQRMSINTLYQLMAHMDERPADFDKARRLLMMPDYFHFLLSGEMCSEYTIASTSQLVNARTKDWDSEVISAAGVERSLFGDLHLSGAAIGGLRKGLADEVGYDCRVVLPCSHDTASAVAAMPALGASGFAGQGDTEGACEPLFLSSGTWSLIGCECEEPQLSEKSRELNYTNEGGYGYRYRLLKNITGLWMIQSIRRELAPEMSFDDIAEAAASADIDAAVDCADKAFLSPDSMYGAVRAWCAERGLRQPEGIGETAAAIYGGLASSYAKCIGELSDITGKRFTEFHVLGGGSKDEYLNALAAEKSGMAVHAGPSEATAIGSIAVQMISGGVFSDIQEARACIADSFGIKVYEGGEHVC
jgi:rhamnulokinase